MTIYEGFISTLMGRQKWLEEMGWEVLSSNTFEAVKDIVDYKVEGPESAMKKLDPEWGYHAIWSLRPKGSEG